MKYKIDFKKYRKSDVTPADEDTNWILADNDKKAF